MGFDPTQYGHFFRYKETSATGGPSAFQVLPPDAYRVALLIGLTTGTVIIRFGLAPDGVLQFALTPSAGMVTFSLSIHGPLMQQSVWLGTGSPQTYFLEVLYQPPSPG